MQEKALTSLSTAGGCAAKIEPALLKQILSGLTLDTLDEFTNVHLREDVGILSLQNMKLAQSIDMITPVSDDPRLFGAIAVSHALNDLYAKGALPLSGLLLLGLPALIVSTETTTSILQGAIDTLHAANAGFLGGHTIASHELQLGIAVTGLIKDSFIPNDGCRHGDLLILTKPLGTGIVTTALKLKNAGVSIDKFSPEMVRLSEETMLSLNDVPSQIMKQVGVNACTDISGFGFLGHLSEMLNSQRLSAHIFFDRIPLLPGVSELAAQDILSAGGERNAAFYWKNCNFANSITYAQKMLLFDPQTAGGLLISASEAQADRLLLTLEQKGVKAVIVGQITRKDVAMIEVA